VIPLGNGLYINLSYNILVLFHLILKQYKAESTTNR
jgi:hypothetical protein